MIFGFTYPSSVAVAFTAILDSRMNAKDTKEDRQIVTDLRLTSDDEITRPFHAHEDGTIMPYSGQL